MLHEKKEIGIKKQKVIHIMPSDEWESEDLEIEAFMLSIDESSFTISSDLKPSDESPKNVVHEEIV